MDRANTIYNRILKIVEKSIGHDGSTFNGELDNYAKFMIPKWRGVYAADQIPKLKKGESAIINLDDSDEPGSHWVSIYQSTKLIVYDSFGRKTSKILPSAMKFKPIDADYDAEQSKKEANCGQRSMAWLILLTRWSEKLAMEI